MASWARGYPSDAVLALAPRRAIRPQPLPRICLIKTNPPSGDRAVRLHSALVYVTPQTKLAGKERELFAQRDAKLESAHERCRNQRNEAKQNVA
jgi:hypothetical protein